MKPLHIILLTILIISFIFNYLSFCSKKTAFQLVNDMGIGYNLGDTFNYYNTKNDKETENEEIKLFGTTLPTKNILKEIRKNGFKTIRFQVLYTNYIYNNGKIKSEWIYKIKELINLIHKLDMYLILSIKHTRQFWESEKKKSKNKYINFWEQIANELIDYDEYLVFESMYEIGYLAYLDRMYNYYEDKDYLLSQYFIDIIRNSGGLNIERLLIVPMLSTDYELSLFNFNYSEYMIPKDPYNKLAISLYYYFPCEEYNPLNDLQGIKLYDKKGYYDEIFPMIDWGSSKNYKDIVMNFDFMKKNFIDKGFPIIIGEVGILNDFIKKNNSIEQFLYTLFGMSSEFEGILPCLWDIPMISSNYNNYYFNKENKEWSNNKYGKIISKISKGKFIKSFNYFYQTNLETEDTSSFGYFTLHTGTKTITKILINARFIKHIDNYIVMTVYFGDRDENNKEINLKEKDGIRQYDGTTIFTIDASELNIFSYVQVTEWFGKNYLIINNVTVQYAESYLGFDYISYKSDILNDINN